MTTETSVKQLPDGDAVFLSTETDTAWGHVGGMSLLDPTGVPDFGFEKLLRAIEQRLVHVPRFRWKLLEVPFGLDRPYWVECPDFDVRKHVHRIAVPSPGGMKELGELAGHLFARPLDRSRPLWEVWYIEGVEGGKVAMFMKNHHCLMDGQAGVGLAEVLTDLSPDATAPPIVPDVMKEGRPAAPSALEIAARAARNADRPPGASAPSTSAAGCARSRRRGGRANATSSRRRRGATCRRSRSTSSSACAAASRARRSISKSSRTSRSTST